MVHGTADWGLVGPKATVYGLDDMGELAVRLGSPVSFDRRGDVMFHEDFSRGLAAWTYACAGAGCGIALDCLSAVTAPYGCKLITGPGMLDHSGIQHRLHYPVLGRIGAECSFMAVTDMAYFNILLYFYDGTNRSEYVLNYNHTLGTVSVQDDLGVYQVIATPGAVMEGNDCFSTMKVVADIANGHYERVLFDDLEIGVQAYTPRVVGDGTSPSLLVHIVAYTGVAASVEPTVDNVVITQNEP
ncbi:MAG: hypothetical protein JRD89_16690 [Deltaproteobacteria bacterium]|nr:hypothetical protein [Deltaproteobacteria bacterium]